jgi:hypothetical protein
MDRCVEGMDPLELSVMRAFYFPGVATYADYKMIGAATGPPPRINDQLLAEWMVTWRDYKRYPPQELHTIPPRANPEWAAANYPPGETGTGAIIQLTLTTVSVILARDWQQRELHLLQVNIGTPQWSVAAVLLGLACMPPAVATWFYECGVTDYPIPAWFVLLKEWMNAMRRCPKLLGCDASPEEVYQLRKLLSCCGRTQAPADYAAEVERRCANEPAHFGIDKEGYMSRNAWISAVRRVKEQVTAEVVRPLGDSFRIEPMWEWWASRAGWMPPGSTSARRTFNLAWGDLPKDQGARPSKKEIAEILPDDYVERIVMTIPVEAARASTKPEPGLKKRAIFPCSDEHFLVQSYASLHLEKTFDVGGMKAKQAPADVAQWVTDASIGTRETVWDSLDYKDFNADHERWQMAYQDHLYAQEWAKLPIDPDVKIGKVAASVWSALANLNVWVVMPGMPPKRLYSGLYSGARNTARSNTEEHGTYSAAISYMLAPARRDATPVSKYFTGDDEATKFEGWMGNLLYLVAHPMCYFDINPNKQLVGEYVEFLQRIAGPRTLPVRPLWAILAQLASGNWYKDVHLWYDSAVNSVSSNAFECHARGMPLEYARRFAAATLDAMMRTPDKEQEGKWIQLEWWSMRHGTKGNPLWANTPGPMVEPPKITAKPLPPQGAPRKATDAWVRLKKRFFRLNDDKWERYSQAILTEAYANWHLNQRGAAHRKYAENVWPLREHVAFDYLTDPVCSEDLLPKPVSHAEVIRELAAGAVPRRPETLEEVLARLGADPNLLTLCGGWEGLLAHMEPTTVARFANNKA